MKRRGLQSCVFRFGFKDKVTFKKKLNEVSKNSSWAEESPVEKPEAENLPDIWRPSWPSGWHGGVSKGEYDGSQGRRWKQGELMVSCVPLSRWLAQAQLCILEGSSWSLCG